MNSVIKPLISNHTGKWKLYLLPYHDEPFTSESHRFLRGKAFPKEMVKAGSEEITQEEALDALEAAIRYYDEKGKNK